MIIKPRTGPKRNLPKMAGTLKNCPPLEGGTTEDLLNRTGAATAAVSTGAVIAAVAGTVAEEREAARTIAIPAVGRREGGGMILVLRVKEARGKMKRSAIDGTSRGVVRKEQKMKALNTKVAMQRLKKIPNIRDRNKKTVKIRKVTTEVVKRVSHAMKMIKRN